MPSPITKSDIPIYNAQADVCDKLELLFRTSDRFRDFLDYVFNDDGSISPEFAADIETALASTIGLATGAVVWIPVNYVPSGYVLANGQSLSREDYGDLFAIYGTSIGSDSATTFKVPNLYDRFLVGGGLSYPIGATGGVADVTLTIDQIPSHKHALDPIVYQLTVNDNTGGSVCASLEDVGPPSDQLDETQLTGGGASHTNLPPYFAGLWLVKT